MERLTLACGGIAVNSTEGMSEEMLGWAGEVTLYSGTPDARLEHV